MQGLIDEVVIIAPYNTADRIFEYTYSHNATYGGGGAELYLDFLESTLMPAVQQSYPRVQPHRLGMAGSSLGGLLTCYAAWTRADVYTAGVACMSPSFWWNNCDFDAKVLAKPATPKLPALVSANLCKTILCCFDECVDLNQVYLDSGDQDGDTPDIEQDTLVVRDTLSKKGMRYGDNLLYYLARGGAHNP